MTRAHPLTLICPDPAAFMQRWIVAQLEKPAPTLRHLLTQMPAMCAEQLGADLLDLPVTQLRVKTVAPRPDLPLYWPDGLRFAAAGPAAGQSPQEPDEDRSDAASDADAASDTDAAADDPAGDAAGTIHPETISEREAVLLAHHEEIARAASYLESGLSVLVRSEKLLVRHLAAEIAAASGRHTTTVRISDTTGGQPTAAGVGLPGMAPSRRSELLDMLLSAIGKAQAGDIIVVPQLDLLAGGTDSSLTSEARELADAVYESTDCVLLGFIDPSLSVPEVLASRFAVRLAIDILPRRVRPLKDPTGKALVPIGRALVTRAEADLFTGFDEVALYKHVAGMNPVRLRHAIRFAYHQHRPARTNGPDPDAPTFRDLVDELRTFKAKTSNSFEVPDVTFGSIGGYEDVKHELSSALAIIGGATELPEHLRTELVPRGFIFHGPPGTGKTLFAKAAASQLGATILVVSGPEITDKYVGESERKIRDLFAEARRNAPTVIVFDEFDSIAARRSGNDDGGSRAGNAIVAQLLTELDGFRPEVPVLVIGTTNRVELIDEALLRPSRFRPIRIGMPELDARRQIAAVHALHFGVRAGPRLLDRIATAAEGLSGDDIRSIFRDARAGHLVEGIAADPWRLGQLIGQLRHTRQQRDADRQRSTASPGAPRRSMREQGSVPFANASAPAPRISPPRAEEGTTAS